MKFARPQENGCWLWSGYRNNTGYGSFCSRLAHRESYEMFKGPIPAGMYVLHQCDVPACVNPEHLRIGTQQENVAEMFKKGRGNRARGERSGTAKLTKEVVLAIRADPRKRSEIATALGIQWQQVDKIKRRITWRHI